MLIDRTDVLNRWAEYIEELFEDDREEEKPEIQKPMEGPPFLKDEVRDALKKMKTGKAAGPGNVTVEALSALST